MREGALVACGERLGHRLLVVVEFVVLVIVVVVNLVAIVSVDRLPARGQQIRQRLGVRARAMQELWTEPDPRRDVRVAARGRPRAEACHAPWSPATLVRVAIRVW